MNKDEVGKLPRFGKTRIRLLIVGFVIWLIAPFAYWGVSEIDHQFGNFAAVGFVLLGGFFVSAAVFSWLSWRWSVATVLTLAGVLVFVSKQVEFKGFTGELVPRFAFKNEMRSPENQIGAKSLDEKRSSLIAEQAIRSSSLQFFGNERNGVIRSPEFNVKWDESPPTVLWRRSIGAGWAGTVVKDRRIYTLFQVAQEEAIAAIDLLTGQTIWETKRPGYHTHPLGGTGPRSTPAIFQDMLISQTASGQLVVCRLETGELVWAKDLIELGGWTLADSEVAITWGRSGSPLVVDRDGRPIVIVPLGGSKKNAEAISLAAFDLETSDLVWRSGRDQIAYSSPVRVTIHGTDHIAMIQEDFAIGYAIDNGRELWRSEWPSKSGADACASQPVLVGENRILLGKGYAQGSKLIEIEAPASIESTSSEWSVKTIWDHRSLLKTKFTSAIYHQGKLFGLSDGILECVDPDSGKRVWKQGRFGQGQMLVVNDHLLVTSEDGSVAIVQPDNGEVLYEMPVLQGITWNIPTVAGPFLVVRNGEEIACLYSPDLQLMQQKNFQDSASVTEQ